MLNYVKNVRRSAHFKLAVLALCMLMAIGCEEAKITPEAAAPFVAEWSLGVESHLLEQASSAAGARALKERLESAAAADRSKTSRDEPPFDDLINGIYAQRDFKPGFVESGKLSERGELVWAALQEVDTHLLDKSKYPIAKISEKLAELETKRQTFKSFDGLKPGAEETAFMQRELEQKLASEYELTPEKYAEMTTTLMESGAGKRLRDALHNYEQLSVKKANMEVEIEQLLAQGLVRYARDMKHFRNKEIFIHPRHDDLYNEQEIRSKRPDEAKGPYAAGVLWRRAAAIAVEMSATPKFLHERVAETLKDALSGETKAVLDGLMPGQPQYLGLLKEYTRYEKMVAAGGWKNVDGPNNLSPGTSSEVVKSLKTRLQIEGYYPADAALDNKYDGLLTAAIKTYQQTHQMKETGKVDTLFWRSLNVPAERRLAQIEINIKRWHKTNVKHDLPVYGFVNIPDFHVELWKGQKREMRVGTVVGDNRLVVDEETEEKVHANRTPVPMAAYIDRIIYNPYWNTPPRLRQRDIDPKARAWLEKQYIAKLTTMSRRGHKPAETGVKTGGPAGAPGDMSASIGLAAGVSAPVKEEPSFTSGSGKDGLHFNLASVRAAVAKGDADGDGSASDEQLKKLFPYLNLETGLVDVSTIQADNIPKWFEENKYEVMFPGRTWEYVRALPGPENSLGLVKIIFPNYDDIYLHDTPAKSLFSHAIRGFSSGCIRMEDPMGVARWLLENDTQWNETKVETTLKKGDYLPIFLKRRVPIFLEYYTVRVDDEGRANFLADLYQQDTFPG